MSSNEAKMVCPKCGAGVPDDAPRGLCPRCVMLGAVTSVGEAPAGSGPGDPPTLERVAAAFPQLEVVEWIGRGGMGFVYKARQPHLDRWVALKLLPDRLARDPQFAERFNREGRFLARLNHPNIVSVYDFGRTPEFYYLMMEFVDGVNLRQAMQAGRFSPAEALSLVPKICEALQYAHEQGVLHRDIKPENILLDSKGGVKIADFGIAKLVGEEQPPVTLTQTGSSLGTPHYMAPEQIERPTEVDHRADIYSLGVVFYEMLTGELPIGRFEPPSMRTPVGRGVDAVVLRTLEKDRDKRYQSAGEVKTEVERTASDPAADPAPGATPEAGGTLAVPSQWISRRAMLAAGLVVGCVALLALPILASALLGGGLGFVELLVFGVPGVVAGVVGTVLGWMAWGEIRAGRGRLGGRGLAIFAAIALPTVVLGLGALTLVALPTWTLTRREVVAAPPAETPWQPQAGRGQDPVGVKFRIPKGHVATVEVFRREDETFTRLDGFAGYFIAPSEERGRGTFLLEPVADRPGRWVMKLVSEDGAVGMAGQMDLGPLILTSNPPMSTTVEVNEGDDRELLLTNPFAGGEPEGTPARAALSLVIRGYRRTDGVKRDATTVGTGSTNWVGTPASHAPRAAAMESAKMTVRAVRLIEDGGRPWLELEYRLQPENRVEVRFSSRGQFPDSPVLLLGGTHEDDSLPEGERRRETLRCSLPDGLDTAALESFRASVSKRWMGKELVMQPGAAYDLIDVSLPGRGSLTLTATGFERQ